MLGICVVYLVPDADAELLLRIHLANLSALTEGPYRVYGVALRMQPANLQMLRNAGIVLPDLPAHDPEGGYAGNRKEAAEHSHYLDQLLDFAFGDGCTHVVTFDMDSWPVAKGWDTYYRKLLQPLIPVIGMQRTETGDEYPNPAFTLVDRSFWRVGRSSFAYHNPRSELFDGAMWARAHSGTGILAELRMNGQRFLPLVRSNRWNPHSVMCGVYDNRIFHFGAGSRQPVFGNDTREYEMIGTELAWAYAKAVNAAKRSFFLDCLKRSQAEFLAQLVYGEIAGKAKDAGIARGGGRAKGADKEPGQA